MYTVKIEASGSFDTDDIYTALKELTDKITKKRRNNDPDIKIYAKWEGPPDGECECTDTVVGE